jgi:hypothetical protein
MDETFSGILDDLESKLGASPNKQGLLDHINGLRSDLKEANNLYRQVNQEADAIIKRPEKSTSGSAAYKVSEIKKENFQKTFNSVLSSGDVKKAAWMAENYPAETALARGSILNDMWVKAQSVKKGPGNPSVGSSISMQIKSMPDAKKTILFGAEGKKKAADMAVYFANTPAKGNPSGSAFNRAFADPRIIGDWMNGAYNAFKAKMASSTGTNKTVNAFGKVMDNPVTRGSSYFLGNETFLPSTEEQPSDSVIFTPNRR